MTRRLSEELVAILRDDSAGATSFYNTGILLLHRLSQEELKREYAHDVNPIHTSRSIQQIFGVPIMLYHGIPVGEWELIQRESGENIISGKLWQDEIDAQTPIRWTP